MNECWTGIPTWSVCPLRPSPVEAGSTAPGGGAELIPAAICRNPIFFVGYYPSLAVFAVVFGSVRLTLVWVTMAAAVYAALLPRRRAGSGLLCLAGDVSAITGAFTGNERTGEVTRFEGFKVDHLTKEYGPVEGTITDSGTGILGEHEAFGLRSPDVIVEAAFTNPLAVDWLYGFIIRSPRANWLDMVVFTDDSRWMHYTRKPNDADCTLWSNGALPDESVMWPDHVNELSLIAIEDEGWLLLIDKLISRLDLSNNQSTGAVSGIAGFFSDHAGPVVSYENFIVWVPGGS